MEWPAGSSAVRREQTHDRSGNVMERTQQQVALGSGTRPGVEVVQRDDPDGSHRGSSRGAPIAAGAGWNLTDRFELYFELAKSGRSGFAQCGRGARFPLDWNHWQIDQWPDKVAEISAASNLPVWVTEAGASSFGAEEVQEFGLIRTAGLLTRICERIHWYSLFDLPRAWPATTRHRESEGSAYYRHFYMGLLHENGSPKLAARHFPRYAPAVGICQWFHFDDHRLDDGVRWLRWMGVSYVRTGLSWTDRLRPGALKWFDRQMRALGEFKVTLTFCFTPESEGIEPHHTSAGALRGVLLRNGAPPCNLNCPGLCQNRKGDLAERA